MLAHPVHRLLLQLAIPGLFQRPWFWQRADQLASSLPLLRPGWGALAVRQHQEWAMCGTAAAQVEMALWLWVEEEVEVPGQLETAAMLLLQHRGQGHRLMADLVQREALPHLTHLTAQIMAVVEAALDQPLA